MQGYAQDLAVVAGESAELALSGADRAEISLARLIHGDPNPAGPGYRDEPAEWFSSQMVDLTPQHLDLGSYVEVGHAPPLSLAGAFTLGLWMFPTRLSGEWQAIAAKWGVDDVQFGLFVLGSRTVAGAVSLDGRSVEWCAGRHYAEPMTWQFVALVHDPARGRLTLQQYCPAARTELATRGFDGPDLMESTKAIPAGVVHAGGAALLFGALAAPETGHWAHFDGKLARPFLAPVALTGEQLSSLMQRGVRDAGIPLLGGWDLSAEVSTTRVVDVSGNELHGRAVNCPGRAVTGPGWSGTLATLYTDDPAGYDAIHLHADDLADAGWEPTLSVRIPSDARPGIYAARVDTQRDQLVVPFVVEAPRPAASLCLLLPTLTWQAYGSNRAPYSFTEDGVLDRTLCLYDVHVDGSPVSYCTRRKPTRSGNPSRGIRPWGAHNLPSDLYLIDWLEWLDERYDVLCDQSLHWRGVQALAPYRCLLLGTHPEYWTEPMLGALEEYLSLGGRVMYLGGNGLYWVTSIDPERPWIVEVRKSGDGDFEPAVTRPYPGQLQHSTDLAIGGLWSRRGRPARRLVGVEHAANVFVDAQGRWGFERLPASYAPEAEFVFDGVGDEVIGNFGLNLGSAAGYEMDATHDWQWPDGWRPTVLARATHPAIMSTMRLPVARAAEVTLTVAPSGGAAVFAAGSVTWAGSLSHNDYANNVSLITSNVMRRFLDTPDGESVLRRSAAP